MNAQVEPAPRPRGSTVRDLRKSRALRLLRRLAIGVGVPTLGAAIYLGLVATPQYESIALFTVQEDGAGGHLPAMLGAIPGSGAARDIVAVREHILSRDMLANLLEAHGFAEHYRNPEADYFSRLGEGLPSEDVYEYYLSQVELEHDELGSMLTLHVRAFTGEDAKRLAQAILDAAVAKVNAMDAQSREDRIALAEVQVHEAETRLTEARRRVLELQQEGAELDPERAAGTLMQVRGGLEGALAEARAELTAMLATMQPDAPRVVAQRQKVASIAGQVERERRRMVGGEGEGLHASIAEFEPVMVEKEFASRAYESAMSMLEMARLDAARQHRYLVTIANPSQPDEPTHPVVWKGVLTTFLVSFSLLGIGSLLVASVREHANV